LPFAAQFRGEQVVVDVGELVGLLVSVHRIVLLLPDVYHLLDPSVHSVALSIDDFGLIPIHDMVERDSMICDCRWIKEAIHIRKEQDNSMNRDEESYQLSHIYDNLFAPKLSGEQQLDRLF